MLENILFAFLALILLIPLLYFLPLGFKKQGKLIIVGISLLLALFGLLANTVFNLWQTSLLLLVFALAATYLIEKRLSTFIFADRGSTISEEEMEGSTEQMDSSQDIEKDNMKFENVQELTENEKVTSALETQLLKESVDDFQEDSLEAALANKSGVQSDSIERQTEIDEDTNGQVSDNGLVEWIDVVEVDELTDKPLVHNEETTEVKEETNDSDDTSIVDYNIDEIINESEENTTEHEPEKIAHDSQEGIHYDTLEELEYMEEDLLSEDEIQVVDEDENEFKVEEESQQFEARVLFEEENKIFEDEVLFEGEDLLVEEELIAEDSELVLDEELVKKEVEVEEEKQLVEVEAAHVEEEIHDEAEIPVVVENQLEETIKTKQVKQQMIHTMVAQLQHSRKYLSRSEYENQVKAHLHPSLPSSDYYTFAYLLIEHYISEHNEKELTSLITHLKEKFTNYAIIQQQLQFLEEYYCKK